MKKIMVVGYKGKMGSLICDVLKNKYLVVGVGKGDNIDDFEAVDLVVDFATHESSVRSAEYCLKRQIPIIIGSTGQSVEENERLDEISSKIKLIRKPNFSMGIDLIKDFIEMSLKLNPQKFEIVEKHHINKKDSPSGTALEIKQFIRERFDGDIEIKSIREGDEMGEHKIIAFCGDEKLTIQHNVYSRDCFVRGIVKEIKNALE